jgi:hypothetical protein
MEQKQSPAPPPPPPQYTMQHNPPVHYMPATMVHAPVSSVISSGSMHLLADIPLSLQGKLTRTGIFYILIGILSIGLDTGLIINGTFYRYVRARILVDRDITLQQRMIAH